MKKGILTNFIDKGFSIIPVREDKIPRDAWKDKQKTPYTIEEVEKLNAPRYGLVTGYADVEVIDVDLKVLSTTSEKDAFWKEYLGLLRESIYDFDNKVVICRTENAGYHIIYKSKRVSGNQKLAVLEDHEEALIETRGIGGMVVIYIDNIVGKRGYFDIDYITDEDWRSIMQISKSYHFIVPEPEIKTIPKKTSKEYKQGITPWDQFNSENDVLDVVGDEFDIIRTDSKKTWIRRKGATSPHSGYIFHDSGCMYLFSSGTSYPYDDGGVDKRDFLLTPFKLFAHRYHNGDFSAAARDLYHQGFGTRLTREIKENEKSMPKQDERISSYLLNKSDLDFPIDIYPKPLQDYLMENHSKMFLNLDFMASSMLWVGSVCIGNYIRMYSKRDWGERPIIWLAIVGKPGSSKTPSIDAMLKPLREVNSRLFRKYIKDKKKFDEYDSMSESEKKNVNEVEKPLQTQFIVNDITLEALQQLHSERDSCVALEKDELHGWLLDMNKYREGSDKQFWLSSWSGKGVAVNRVGRGATLLENPFIPVIGGVQPQILESFFTEENIQSGFMDRLLLCYPKHSTMGFDFTEMSYESVAWYNDFVNNMYSIMEYKHRRDEEGQIAHYEAVFDSEAKKEWLRIIGWMMEKEVCDNENEIMKSMYPKFKAYTLRFAIILHVMHCVAEGSEDFYNVTKKSILGAEKLSKYFIAMFKKVQINALERNEMIKRTKKSNTRDSVRLVYEADPDFNRTQLAETLGVSRQTINNNLKAIRDEKKV